MNQSKWKTLLLSENSLLIWVPATVILMLLSLLFVYGLQEPDQTEVPIQTTTLDHQLILQDDLRTRFEEGEYSAISPLLVQNPFAISPLTAVLLFTTETEEAFVLTIDGKGEQADLVYITDSATEHMIPVYGLYPDYVNTVRLHKYDEIIGDKGEAMTTISIQTDPLAEGVKQPESINVNKEYFGQDWMVLTPAEGSLPAAYDSDGNVRWYLTIATSFVFEELENGHFLVGSDRSAGAPYYRTGLYEIDYLGQIYTIFEVPGGFHHDAVELPDGNLLILSGQNEETVDDVVIEMSRSTGAIVNTWDLSELMATSQGRAEMGTDTDWFHATSIDYNPLSDHFIVSGRHQDIILNIDRASGELQYLLGNPTNWNSIFVNATFLVRTDTSPTWFYAPYDAVFASGGDILVFDNGNNRSKNPSTYISANDNFSRAILYDVNLDMKRATQLDTYGQARSFAFYSPYLSNVRYYGSGHYLIHSGGITATASGPLNVPPVLYDGTEELLKTSITVEMDGGVKRYELKMNDHFVRATRIDPTQYQSIALTNRRTLGSQAITPLVTEPIETSITVFKQIRLEYNLHFLKETDRLIVEGTFLPEDIVYLELVNHLGTKRYHIPTTSNPCVELCLTPDTGTTIFYLNEAGLVGTFELYLRVNGHRYYTNQYVTFD